MDFATFIPLIGICAVGTFYLVRGARDVFPDALAPEPATKRSKGLMFLTTLTVGAGLGALGLAPNVTGHPSGPAVSGLIVGALVFGGAKLPGLQALRFEDKGRLGKKRTITKEEAKKAGMTTGQFEALNAAEQTPGPGYEPPKA